LEFVADRNSLAGTGTSVADVGPRASSRRGFFDLVRLAATSLWGRKTCLAVWSPDSSVVHVSTSRPLRYADLKHLENEVRAAARKEGLMEGGAALQLSVNGSSARAADDGSAEPLVQTLALPVSMDGEPAGVIVLGAFSRLWTRSQEKLIRRKAREAAEALRLLWELILGERDRYHALLEVSLEGYILCDWHKQILFHNPSALRLLDLDPDGDQRATLSRAMETMGLAAFINEAMQHGIFELNKIFTTGEGRERIVGVNIKLLRQPGGKEIGWLLTLRDVTAAWEVDRMKSMLSVASHEINTPLASVQNAVDLLLDREIGDLNERQERCLEVIHSDVSRLRQLLRDLLDLSVLDRREAQLDRRHSVKLSYIARKVADSFEWLAEERQIALRVQIPDDIPEVQGDRDRITQVFVNLIDNALRFTPPQGEVEVKTVENASEIVVSVRDTGVGIAADDLERIFEKFEQSDNLLPGAERGYGLGLSIAKEIVHGHRGRIWVESTVGKGSTFYFSLPK